MSRLLIFGIALVLLGWTGISLAAWCQSHRDFTDTVGWVGIYIGVPGVCTAVIAAMREMAV